jgi:hypothetical protein
LSLMRIFCPAIGPCPLRSRTPGLVSAPGPWWASAACLSSTLRPPRSGVSRSRRKTSGLMTRPRGDRCSSGWHPTVVGSGRVSDHHVIRCGARRRLARSRRRDSEVKVCRTPATRRSNRNILTDSARPRQIAMTVVPVVRCRRPEGTPQPTLCAAWTDNRCGSGRPLPRPPGRSTVGGWPARSRSSSPR